MDSVSLQKVAFASVVTLVAYLWSYYRIPHRDKRTGFIRIPRWPLIGNSLQLVTQGKEYILETQNLYGNEFITNELGRDVYNFCTVEGNKWIFKGDNKYLINSWPQHWKEMLGRSSVPVVPPDVHKIQRPLLAPAFSPKKLEEYLVIIEECSRRMYEKACQESQEGKIPVDVISKVAEAIFTISADILIGEKDEKKIKELRELYTIYSGGLAGIIPYALPFTAYGKSMKAREKVLDIVSQKMKEIRSSNEKRTDLLTVLIESVENGTRLNDVEIKDQIIVFLFASFDTTTSSITSLIATLAENKRVYEKLKKEVDEIFPVGKPIELSKIGEATYLEATVKEVLRLYSPVRGGIKDVVEDVEYGNVTIPKGSSVTYNIYTSHEDNFTNPREFDPERFLEPRVEDKEPYTFIPFGAGPHMCIGFPLAKLELKVFTIMLLREYKFENKKKKILPFPFHGVVSQTTFAHLQN